MLSIIHYPHPTLIYKSKVIKRVDADLRGLIAEMFELMYEANGVGLAANQVDLPLRLFVVNLAANPEEGEEMVFINPVISRPKGSVEQEEGCLSIPGVYGKVVRPKTVRIQAYNLSGEAIDWEADGLLSRVLQHENDHLDGVLFTTRMSDTGKMDIADAMAEFEAVYDSQRETGGAPTEPELEEHWRQWEGKYC